MGKSEHASCLTQGKANVGLKLYNFSIILDLLFDPKVWQFFWANESIGLGTGDSPSEKKCIPHPGFGNPDILGVDGWIKGMKYLSFPVWHTLPLKNTP